MRVWELTVCNCWGTQEIVCVLKRVAVDTVDTRDNCECAAIVIIGSGNSSGEARGGGDKIILIKRRPGFCHYLLSIDLSTKIKKVEFHSQRIRAGILLDRSEDRGFVEPFRAP